MLGLTASKWATHSNSTAYSTCSQDAEDMTTFSSNPHLLSPQDSSTKTSSILSIQATQSNPSVLTPFIMSVPVQSPFGTAPSSSPLRYPLFVLPKKSIVRITAPLPPSPTLSSTEKNIQKKTPDQSSSSLSTENNQEHSGRASTDIIDNKASTSSAEAFFGEEQQSQAYDLSNKDPSIKTENPIQHSSYGSIEPHSEPNSLSEINTSNSTIDKQTPMSKPRTMGGDSQETFVNPYAAYVAEIDPEGTMDDGRSYVGGARHYVDDSALRDGHPLGPPKSANATSVSAHQRRSPDIQQNQTHNKPSNMPPNASSRSSSIKQRGYSRSDRDRRMPESRWSGRPLATADTLPEDFFGTAKAISTPTSSSAPKTLPRYEDPSSSSNWSSSRQPSTFNAGGRSSSSSGQFETRGHTQTSESRYPPPRTPVDDSRSEGYNSYDQKPPSSPGYTKYHQHAGRPQYPNQEFDSARRNGQNEDIDHSMRTRDVDPYDSDLESSVSRVHLSSTSRDMSSNPALASNGNRVEPQPSAPQALPIHSGNPLFLQYPIGDGCHVVVAMYVEKDAQTAVKRFPGIERTRQESSRRDKSLDDVAQIFKEALEDEKKNVLES
ncbi:hypothetical protein BGZ76_007242 [Entomortierella beljakovae]|nr:hypothetical protein BGZ76_007242 [Entomortierella beljakovae]